MKTPVLIIVIFLFTAICNAQPAKNIKYERLVLKGETPVTLELAYIPGFTKKHPAILILGTLKAEGQDMKLPE
ncbi:MAG: hypothetical protein EOP51_20895 [Sphingobacteriales bacterium]|nr:MAG: hypothetical protein EOP51_20895 [Sphingobacteriales bacterium]